MQRIHVSQEEVRDYVLAAIKHYEEDYTCMQLLDEEEYPEDAHMAEIADITRIKVKEISKHVEFLLKEYGHDLNMLIFPEEVEK